jgi:hypothetical protein
MHCCAWFQASVDYGASQYFEPAPVNSAHVSSLRRRDKMIAVTYGLARVPAVKAAPKAERAETNVPRESWFVRFFNAMAEARMAQARREIRMHTRLLPYTLDARGNRLVQTKSGDMPFGGW